MKKVLSIIAAVSIIISAFSVFSITASAAVNEDICASVGAGNTIVHIIDTANQTTDITVPVGSDFVLPEGKDFTMPKSYVNKFVEWRSGLYSYCPGESVKITGETTFKALYIKEFL